ncbi:MAG: co-chaperone GroES [Planctomycetota bacterium]|jgi:chaperonin GroES
MATATKSKKININITPIGDKVIVQRDEADTMTDSGLYLPEQAKDTPKTGTVIAVGTGALNTETGERIPMTLAKGDRVIFTSYAGSEIKVDGEEVLVRSEDEILAIFD